MEISKGCVYFFRHIGLSPVKIGYSENESPISRFKQFKVYAPYGSEILGFIQAMDAKELESKIHKKFESRKLLGEWFELTEEEVQAEIDFHSSIEDVRERNEFQLKWAKMVQSKKQKVDIDIFNENNKRTGREKFKFEMMYKENPNLNRTKTAEKLDVSRKTIITWIKEIEKKVSVE